MGQNCKPYMVLWYLLSIHSSANPNADILVTSLVLKHCAHALRHPRGCYFNCLDRRQQVRGRWGDDCLKTHDAEGLVSRYPATRSGGRFVRGAGDVDESAQLCQ